MFLPEPVCFCVFPPSSCDPVTLCSLLSPADCPLFAGDSSSTDSSSDTGLMEGGDSISAMGASDESPSEVDFPVGPDGGLVGTFYERISPEECPLDAGDGGSLLPERLVPVGAAADGPGRGCSPGWALAMYGEDCFGRDVIQYAENLGQHTSACLDRKMQVGEAAVNPGAICDLKTALKQREAPRSCSNPDSLFT